MSPLEKSRHSFVGEADTVRWAIGKFRNYLWGSEFMVMSDCSGLKKISESEANVPHVAYVGALGIDGHYAFSITLVFW